jgi:hypothetical protein
LASSWSSGQSLLYAASLPSLAEARATLKSACFLFKPDRVPRLSRHILNTWQNLTSSMPTERRSKLIFKTLLRPTKSSRSTTLTLSASSICSSTSSQTSHSPSFRTLTPSLTSSTGRSPRTAWDQSQRKSPGIGARRQRWPPHKIEVDARDPVTPSLPLRPWRLPSRLRANKTMLRYLSNIF